MPPVSVVISNAVVGDMFSDPIKKEFATRAPALLPISSEVLARALLKLRSLPNAKIALSPMPVPVVRSES